MLLGQCVPSEKQNASKMLAHSLICRHDIDHVVNDEHNRTIIVVLAKQEIAP